MNRGPVIFFSAFLAFAISFALFVLAPQIQIGRQSLTTVVGSGGDVYPKARPGQAVQGAKVYRAEGCAYCHSQQVRQSGIVFDVVLTDAGTNQAALAAALGKLNVQSGASLPQTVLSAVKDKSIATKAAGELKATSAKAEIHVVPVGPDIARGWGLRRSVAADYLFDSPVLLGSQRIGPDLANVGARLPDANWQLLHLYNPKIFTPDSVMPPYRFLFKTRKIIFAPSPDALSLPGKFALPAGYEVVPTDKVRALVAYLQSLRVDAPLFEAPMTVAAAPVAATTTNAVTK